MVHDHIDCLRFHSYCVLFFILALIVTGADRAIRSISIGVTIRMFIRYLLLQLDGGSYNIDVLCEQLHLEICVFGLSLGAIHNILDHNVVLFLIVLVIERLSGLEQRKLDVVVVRIHEHHIHESFL